MGNGENQMHGRIRESAHEDFTISGQEIDPQQEQQQQQLLHGDGPAHLLR